MTAEPVTVVLLGEPVAFARMRLNRALGSHYVPAHQRNTAAAMRLAAEYAMREQGATMFDVPLRVELVAEFTIPASWSKKKRAAALLGQVRPGRPDIDNIYKLMADAFSGVVYRDDCLVAELGASKRYSVQPKLVVTVAPIGQAGELPLRSAAA